MTVAQPQTGAGHDAASRDLHSDQARADGARTDSRGRDAADDAAGDEPDALDTSARVPAGALVDVMA